MSGSTDGLGAAARFTFPFKVAVDSAGNILVTDSGTSALRKITPAGQVSSISISSVGRGAGVAIAPGGQGTLLTDDSGVWLLRPDGRLLPIAGQNGLIGSQMTAPAKPQPSISHMAFRSARTERCMWRTRKTIPCEKGRGWPPSSRMAPTTRVYRQRPRR